MSSAPVPAQLHVRRDLRVVARIDLADDPLTVGRSSLCGVVLNHPSVSRQHARFEPRGAQWHVVDCGSTNGVWLNGRRVHDAPVRPGDVIEIRPFGLELIAETVSYESESIRLLASGDVCTIVSLDATSSAATRRRLDDLYTLARLVLHHPEAGSFWPVWQSTLRHALAAERCVLIGVDEDGRLFPVTAGMLPTPDRGPLGVSRTVIGQVVESRQAVLVRQVHGDARLEQAASLVAGGTGTVICAPVMIAGRTRALVYADRPQNQPPFAASELEFVTAAVELAAAAARLDELHAAACELAHVRGRIEAGREVQEALLPTPLPQPPWGEVAAVYCPAERVSGDIYDVQIDGQGRLLTMLADVSGKGVPAALLSAVLQNTLRLALDGSDDLAAAVARANAVLAAHSGSGAFCTLVLCRWSADGGRVEIANAGHPAPVWLKADGSTQHFPERTGLALGLEPDWDGRIVECDAHDARLVLLATDGVLEARSAAGEEYGVRRLGHALAQAASSPASGAVERITSDVRHFCAPAEPVDDLTLLAVSRRPPVR
jgi:serine phosphatase RsbU (regulator of sigma subunit)